MRNILTGLLSAALMLGVAGTADAKSKKKDEYAWFNSPSAIAARQRDANTFDETQYYERDGGSSSARAASIGGAKTTSETNATAARAPLPRFRRERRNAFC
jgi:hypothetical protein